ncbi:MAG: PaaI family thioesterase [Actinobacteria bacterium]|nr:PaaI family thioesterase [Actinomycetota bacterium]
MSARTRTITWHDPAEAAALAHGLTGLDFLHRTASGQIPPPPVAELVGFRPTYVMPGRVVFAYEAREEHYNPLGSVHGGILTTVLDTVMGCAVQSLLEAGVSYATIELKMSFVRPVTLATGALRAEGSIVHAGSRVATAEARLVDAEGKLFAHATSTFLVKGGEERAEAPIAA